MPVGPGPARCLPVFSKKPLGKYSRTSSTRVRLSPSGWKVTTPLTVPFAPSVVQPIRSSGTCSVTFARQLRVDLATFTFQSLLVSSACSTLTTPLAKVLNSWNWVHWLYASRAGTPTSMSSTIVTLFDLPPPLLPRPLPKTPLTFSFSDSLTDSFSRDEPNAASMWTAGYPHTEEPHSPEANGALCSGERQVT